MKYYPKSQIKTNLYTNGNEFVISLTQENYKGYYWGTSTGEFYTGKSPEDIPNNKLIPLLNIDINTLKTINEPSQNIIAKPSYHIIDEPYFRAKKIPFNKQAPIYPVNYIPYLKEIDYNNGYIMRYFIKKNNELKYIEISPNDYQLYQLESPIVPYEMYSSISFKWDLNPNTAYNNNFMTILKIERNNNFIGFTKYFNNKFEQFVKK